MEALVHILKDLWTTPPSALHQNYVLFGGFIGLFGLVSLFVKEKLYLTESLVATFVGILFGPYGLKIVVPEKWFGENLYWVLREAARLVIGLQVMAAGVSTPGEFLCKNKLAISIMLGPVMAVMWAISALSIQATLGLGWRESLIVAACVTPTDPVLAHSVIKGKFAERYIPTRLRHLLAVESGANDGLGFPFMMLPMWLLLSGSTQKALSQWIWHTWVWEIFVSIVVGFVCGFSARYLLKFSLAHKLIDKESFLVFTIALTLFVSGVVALMASDDLFAIFIAGNVFAWDDQFVSATEHSHISQVLDMLFNITFFVFFGAQIPWRRFVDADLGVSSLLGAAVLIILFRRLPVVMAMRSWIPTLQSRKEAFFAGWFGPMGVGAIFFAIQARDIIIESSTAVNDSFASKVFPVVAFIVLASIVIHGITVPLTNSHLKRRKKRKVKRCKKREAMAAAAFSPISFPQMEEDHDDAASPDVEDPTAMEEEYIYVTDDEDNAEMLDYESTIQEGASPLTEVTIDPASPQSTVHRTRRVKRVIARPGNSGKVVADPCDEMIANDDEKSPTPSLPNTK